MLMSLQTRINLEKDWIQYIINNIKSKPKELTTKQWLLKHAPFIEKQILIEEIDKLGIN
jgi:hypothetical protein